MIDELRIKVFDIFMYSIMIFPIMTVVTDSGIINKILFGLLIASYILIVSNKKIKKKTFIIIFIMILGYLISILNTNFPLVSYNMMFYYPFIIIYMLFINDYKERFIKWFLENEKIVRLVIKIWTFIVGISIFMPSSYYIKEGGEMYFGSFVNTIFRLGPACILIMALVLISISLYKRKGDLIYTLIPMYSFFMGSSRTYLVVGIFIFLIALYIFFNDKMKFFFTLIPTIIVGGLIIVNTSLYQKILFTLDDSQYGDFWFRVTSGRSEFWENDLIAWSNVSVIKKVFGAGLDFTHEVSNLWAHNDFIEILCANGVVGLFIYVVVMLKSILKEMKRSYMLTFFVFIAWFFNAFFNMHYTYFCCVLGFPFILIAIDMNTKINNSSSEAYREQLKDKTSEEIVDADIYTSETNN